MEAGPYLSQFSFVSQDVEHVTCTRPGEKEEQCQSRGRSRQHRTPGHPGPATLVAE